MRNNGLDSNQSEQGKQKRTSSETDLGRNGEDEAARTETMQSLPSGDGGNRRSGKKYKKGTHHRHTHYQISEMESFFRECPHPDDRQRRELGQLLGMKPLQIKFWFQNRRTQLKSQQEHCENKFLRSDNKRLLAENTRFKNALLSKATCPNCGITTTVGEMSFDEQQLRMENARLKAEIAKMSGLATKYAGKVSPQNQTISGSLDEVVVGHNHNDVAQPQVAAVAVNDPLLTATDKSMISEMGMIAVNEIKQLALSKQPLWVPGNYGTEVLNEDEYIRLFPSGLGPPLLGARTESSRQSSIVIMDHFKLVEILMDVNQWANMFCGIVSRAVTHQVLSTGEGARYDGALQVMSAEFQVQSPFVGTRDNYFIRCSKKNEGNSWTVVDFPMDHLRPGAITKTRRHPSGCIIQELPRGYSKVIWVEHVQVDDSQVHRLYKNLVDSGLAFGAGRWVSAMDRACERLASTMVTNIPQGPLCVITSQEGRRSVMNLAERMVLSFSNGAGSSTANAWTPLPPFLGDVRVMSRKCVNDPTRPHGIVLSAATSLWLPLPPTTVFQFLRSENTRNQWDVLSNNAQVFELAHIANGREEGNCVSLFRVVNHQNVGQNNMLIVQESFSDATGSFVVYAPVDLPSMNAVLSGGNPDCVALLPSGFAILPDGPALNGGSGPITEVGTGGTLLTVALQLLVDTVPASKLSVGSVNTVRDIISNTVERIQNALLSPEATQLIAQLALSN